MKRGRKCHKRGYSGNKSANGAQKCLIDEEEPFADPLSYRKPEAVVPAKNKSPKCHKCGFPVRISANGVHRCPIDEEDLFPVDPSSRCVEIRVETHVRGTAIPEKSPNGPVIPLNAPPTPACCRPTRIDADPTPYRPKPSTAPPPRAAAQSVPETAPDTRGNGQSTPSISDSAPSARKRALVSPSASDCNVPSGSQTGEEAKEPTQGAVCPGEPIPKKRSARDSVET